MYNNKKLRIDTGVASPCYVKSMINTVNTVTPESIKHRAIDISNENTILEPKIVNRVVSIGVVDEDHEALELLDETGKTNSYNECDTNVIVEHISIHQSCETKDICLICLDDNTVELMHFSFFSFNCNCNYHVHFSCLCDWIKKRRESSMIPNCLTCSKPISSYEYQYIQYKDIEITSPLSTITDNTDNSVSSTLTMNTTDTNTTTDTLTSIISVVSNTMQDTLHNRSYNLQQIRFQNRILQHAFNNRTLTRQFARHDIEEIVEREVQRQRFLDRVAHHRARVSNTDCLHTIFKLIMFMLVIIGVLLLVT